MVAELQDQERQPAAEDRGIDEIVEQMAETEPKRRRRGKLGIAASDPAAGKQMKAATSTTASRADMVYDGAAAHAGERRKHRKTRNQNDRDAVGDRHREQIA